MMSSWMDAMDCLDDNQIGAMVEDRLSPADRAAVEEHLDTCPSCRTLVAAAAPELQTAPGAGARAPLRRGAAVDRYLILDVLGAGGMGIVYLAYDPELARKVALKLLRPTRAAEASRAARILREARAMAKLSHPNVVAVYDVGEVEAQVFIVMEFVDGAPLSRWLCAAPRGWAAVVAAFVQAGCGLAAAHAAGLVHRDFKPENVLVAGDGRVKVGDFGLARAIRSPDDDDAIAAATGRFTGSGALAGTIAYMAPEQHHSDEVDARTDVFSFCVALYEGLYAEHPFGGRTAATLPPLREASRASGIPPWLRAVVVRGLERAPAERYPSMAALLAALERDPARRRRRLAWFALAVAALVGAVFVGSRLQAAGDRTCTGAPELLAGVWDEPQRQAARAAFHRVGKPWAEDSWRTVAASLDRYAGEWVASHTQACSATRVTHQQSEAVMELRLRCLDERRERLRQLVRLLVTADDAIVEHAARGVQSLPRLHDCADVAWLSARVPPPSDPHLRRRVDATRRELAEVEALHFAGRYRDGETRAAAVVATARALAYKPLLADAQRVWASLLDRTGEYARAAAVMGEALLAAEAGRDRRLAAHALSELVWIRGAEQGHHERALELGDHAAALIEGLGGDEPLEALLAANRSTVLGSLGRYAEAERVGRLAVRKGEAAHGPEHYQVAIAVNNLAATLGWMGRNEEALVLQQQALALYERIVGPHHPQYAHTLMNVASALAKVGRHDEALDHAARARLGLLAAFGPDHAKVASAENMLGLVRLYQERPREAQAHFERALAIALQARGNDHPTVAYYTASLAESLALQERHPEAIVHFDAAIAHLERIGDPVQAARTRRALGQSLLATGAVGAAIASLERALVVQERDDPDLGLLAETRFELARALARAEEQRARARTLATEALAAANAASPPDAALRDKVQAWLDATPAN